MRILVARAETRNGGQSGKTMIRLNWARMACILFVLVGLCAASDATAQQAADRSSETAAETETGLVDMITSSPGTIEHLHSAGVAAIEARIAHAKVRRSLVSQQIEKERQVEKAEVAAELARRDRDRYLKGEADRKRVALRAGIEISSRRHEQIADRLIWSERLANEGLITQAELESDRAAVHGLRSELDAARERLSVFEAVSHPRMTMQTEAEVIATQSDAVSAEQLGNAAAREIETRERIAREVHEDAVRRVEHLYESSSDGDSKQASVPTTTRSEWRVQKQALELSQAELRRAESEAAIQRRTQEADVAESERLLAAAELELEEFLKSKKFDRRRELLSRIRSIAESVSEARQQLEWAQRVVRKGYITRSQLKADELVVQQRESALRDAELELKMLDEHTLRRDEYRLKANLDRAKRELSRRQRLADALREESNEVLDARRDSAELERQRLEEIAKALPGGESSLAAGGG